MDPNKTLRLILEGLRDMQKDDPETVDDLRADVVDHLESLMEWIICGGFAPDPSKVCKEMGL